MRRLVWLTATALAVAVAALCLGCNKCGGQAASGPGPRPAGAAKAAGGAASGDVVVYIPCGMTATMKPAIKEFKATHPGIEIKDVYETGSILAEKIVEKGERPDVLLSAGSAEIGTVETAGLADQKERRTLGTFKMVVVVKQDSTLDLNTPEDLLKCKTITIAEPPINSSGVASKEALENLGLWTQLEPRIVKLRHPVEAYEHVVSGKADATVCFNACPLDTNPEKMSRSQVRVCFELPPDSYTTQHVYISVLKDAKNAPAAAVFCDWLAKDGQKVLVENGMPTPETPSGAPETAAAAPAAGQTATAPTGPAAAADEKPVVEVVAFYPGTDDHKPIREMVEGLGAKYGPKVHGEFVDFTTDEGFERRRAAGLDCGAIQVNGETQWSYEKDGQVRNATFKMRPGGEWTEADLYAVVEKVLKEADTANAGKKGS